ncbi:MAG: outer membrane protein transport protein, partial [Planctomycetales bacterium]|nr:outer membrane protein transport protein [Planctomycetales bacterium]
FEINSADELGGYRQLSLDLDYPSIVSLGVAYRGFRRVRIASDVRYIDYGNTQGFDEAGFDGTGAVTGFGWSSIWTVATGVEWAVNDRFALRVGYMFNESPIQSAAMFYNSPAPALVQHHLSTGFSYHFARGWIGSFAYHYGFEASQSGSWWHPSLGSVPGTEVTAKLATHGLVGGISRRF